MGKELASSQNTPHTTSPCKITYVNKQLGQVLSIFGYRCFPRRLFIATLYLSLHKQTGTALHRNTPITVNAKVTFGKEILYLYREIYRQYLTAQQTKYQFVRNINISHMFVDSPLPCKLLKVIISKLTRVHHGLQSRRTHKKIVNGTKIIQGRIRSISRGT